LILAQVCSALQTKPALNSPPQLEVQGVMPYEMLGRPEPRPALVDFEDLSGWTVSTDENLEADFIRSREEQLWGNYVGRLVTKGTNPGGAILLKPANPIPIPEGSDSIDLWIYGNNWSWAPEPGTPMMGVSIIIQLADGTQNTVRIATVMWKEWWLAHKRYPIPLKSAKFVGLRIEGVNNTEPRTIYFDSLSFYKESLKPLKFEPRPARNLKLFPGQTQGTNGTGKGKLPFPTREETILPLNLTKGYKNSVIKNNTGTYVFNYSGTDCKVKYTYTPKTGSLGEIAAYVNGKKSSVPLSSGGIEFNGIGIKSGKLKSAKLTNGVLKTVFVFGNKPGYSVEYSFRIWGKSLVMDFICRGGKAMGVSVGEVTKSTNPKLILVPYLTLGSNHPRVLCSGTADSPVFTSVWVDWYRSNGTNLWSNEGLTAKAARINGGIRYSPKTNSKRNDLYERLFLTVSPTFEETLPVVPNPPSPNGKIAGERLWQESWGPGDYEVEHKRSQMIRSYGIDMLTQCNHEITWRDGGESFTYRLNAAPKKGGDEALKKYVAAQRSLGWLSGLYSTYTDYAPVNSFWNPDNVQRDETGEWRPGWTRCYAAKPARAVEFDARLAKQIQAKFGSNAAYTDVHTAVAPWAYCDMDARTPGASTLASTFYAYGEILWNDQHVYGPTWSEGTYHWMYAGLATGNYALDYGPADYGVEPLNVAFDLMQIHSKECDIGMAWTDWFLKSFKRDDIDFDHFIGATMAYGHIGWLIEESYGIRRTCRSYYMLQQVQKRYIQEKPRLILYADDQNKWHNVSSAIATDVIQKSRLYVEYENGFRVYVNGSNSTWDILVKKRLMHLPSWGYCAFTPNGDFIAYCADIDGHRVDYVDSDAYEYLDGRDTFTRLGYLAASGVIAVRRKPGNIEIINIEGNKLIGVKAPDALSCESFDEDGKSIASVELTIDQNGFAWFTADPKVRSYRISTGTKAELPLTGTITTKVDKLVPGEKILVTCALKSSAGVTLNNAVLRIGNTSIPITGMREKSIYEGSPLQSTVEITVPDDLQIGDTAFVTLEVSTINEKISIYKVMEVAPAFRIVTKSIADNKISLFVHNDLEDSTRPRRTISTLSDGKIINASFVESAKQILLTPVEKQDGAQDKLIITAFTDDFKIVKTLDLTVKAEYPTIWKMTSDADITSMGQAFRNRKEKPLDTSTGSTCRWGSQLSGGIQKNGLFTHPPYNGGVGYTFAVTNPIQLPESPSVLHMFIGLTDGGNPSDGVDFKVFVIDSTGSQKQIMMENWAKREWKEITLDLSEYAGKKISLKFTADVGPNNSPVADWAAWAEPAIVEKQAQYRVVVK